MENKNIFDQIKESAESSNCITWFTINYEAHRVSIHAAQVAFFIFISFFPFIMFLFSVLQYTPLDKDTIENVARHIIPGDLSSMVDSWLEESYRVSSGAILSATMISALWAGSKGLYGIIFEMDQIYEVNNKRNLFVCRIQSIFYTVAFTLMIILSLTVLVYGNQIVNLISTHFPHLSQIRIIGFLIRSAVSFLLLVAYFLILFRFVPKHKTKFRDELPGAGLVAFLWIAFSYLYSIYVDHYGASFSIYGSLTSLVLLMLWLYFCILFIFIGALLNRYLQKYDGHLKLRASVREIISLLPPFPGSKK